MRSVALSESRPVLLATRIALLATAVALFVHAIQSVLVISRYAVQPLTGLWMAASATALVSLLGSCCATALVFGWRWSVWLWAVSVAIVAAVGLALGLNRSFLLGWEILLPWALLIASSILGLRHARPWKDAA